MMFARIEPASPDALQDEYLPPVEVLQTEPGAWFVPWERQLEVVMAWQAAGATSIPSGISGWPKRRSTRASRGLRAVAGR